MTIELRKVADQLYCASAKAAAWRGGESWSSDEPLDIDQIVKELAKRGFHQQDIGDAIVDADREWGVGSQSNSSK